MNISNRECCGAYLSKLEEYRIKIANDGRKEVIKLLLEAKKFDDELAPMIIQYQLKPMHVLNMIVKMIEGHFPQFSSLISNIDTYILIQE